MGNAPLNREPRITHQSLRVLRSFLEDATREVAGTDMLDATRLASGTLYPILARFETAGWLKSRWESVDPVAAGRPRKRLYRLTALGARRASELLEEIGSRVIA